MKASEIPTPECWPQLIRKAMLHVASLARWDMIYIHSTADDNQLEHIRSASEIERKNHEISLLKEEIRIKDARMAKIPPQNRPHYPPAERMAILLHRAARGWSNKQTAKAFRKWCKRKKIKPRYGAVGKYGSIAIIERFIRTMKDECTRQILMPLNLNDMRQELALYLIWLVRHSPLWRDDGGYNEFRLHQSLKGRTPQEVYANSPPVLSEVEGPFNCLSNSQLPEMKLLVSYLAGRGHLPIVELKKAV